MPKLINYQKQIETVDNKIQKLRLEIEQLQSEKKNLIELNARQEEEQLLEYIRKNKINALDIISNLQTT